MVEDRTNAYLRMQETLAHHQIEEGDRVIREAAEKASVTETPEHPADTDEELQAS